jgi:hypothetical protein
MKSFLFIAFLASFSAPANADVQSMINSWKQHNAQVMDLKKKPEKYGLAPRGFYEIQYAAVTLQIAKTELNCNANNRKVCSNQLAANEVK